MNRQSRNIVDGVLLLDKPAGITSNDALMRVRRLMNARKAGHGGTLDPMATGLLPIALGEATKFVNDALDADKTYLAELTFGVTTSTADAEGEVLERAPVAFDEARLRAVVAGFVGEIDQVPPMHSALKRDGRPLYEYARAGITLERAARRVTIHAIDLVSLSSDDAVTQASTGGLPAGPAAPAGSAAPAPDAPAAPGSVRAVLRVRCSKGTYIRTLAEDIGRVLGCGAHLSGLRRERVGAFGLDDAVTIERLDAMSAPDRAGSLLPADFMLADLAVVELDEALARRFLQGQRLRLNGAGASRAACATGTRVRVYRAGRLLGTAVLEDGLLVPQRLIGTVSEPPPSAASSPLQSDLQP